MSTIDNWTIEGYLPKAFYVGRLVQYGRDIHIFSAPTSSTLKHYVFNLDTRDIVEKAPPQGGGQSPAACCLNDKIYLISSTSRMQIYDIPTDTWSDGAIISVVYTQKSQLLAVNGKLYYFTWYQWMRCYEYDPAADSWTTKTILSASEAYDGVVVGSDVYLVTTTDGILRYDTTSDKLVKFSNNINRVGSSMAYNEGVCYFVGKSIYEEDSREIYTFNLEDKVLKLAGYLPIVGRSYSRALFSDGRLYVFGGGDRGVNKSIISTNQFSTNPEPREKIHIVLTGQSNADLCISSGLNPDAGYAWKSDDDTLAVMVEDGANTAPTGAAAVLGVDVTKP